MSQRSVFVVSLAGLAAFATTANAQLPRAKVFVSPYAGYMSFGDNAKGPLGSSLSTADGTVYGAQLGVGLAPGIALIGNVGYISSKLQVGLPFLGGISVGDSKALLYDGGLQLGIPGAGVLGLPISPFVQAGVGAIRFDISNSLVKTNATNIAYNFGAGADIAFSRNLGLRIMAKDYIGKFDIKEATGLGVSGETSHNWALSGGLKLSF